MKKLIIIFIFLLIAINAFSAFEYMPGNVQARSICFASTALIMGIDNSIVNPASINGVRNIDANLSYENLYLFTHTASLGAGYKSDYGSMGIKYSELFVMGDYADEDSILDENTRLHTERTVQVTYGTDVMDLLMIGTNVNFLYLEQKSDVSENYNNLYYTVDVGLIGKIYERWLLGITVSNVSNTYINGSISTYRYYIDRKVSAGFSFEPYKNVITSFDISKVSGEPSSFAFGVIYEMLKDKFSVSTGVRSYPISYGAGFKVTVKKVSIDYGYTGTAQLPATHHMQISYAF